MAPRDADHPSTRRLLVVAHGEPRTARLHPGDVEHALRVLRLRAGDELIALDGRGSAWRARVGEIRAREVEVELLAPLESSPPPGSAPDAPARVRVFVALPRPGPAEELVDRLTQLGASAIVPLLCQRAGPHARELSASRRERLERVAREALKQSGRLWMPEIGAPTDISRLGAAEGDEALAVLSPGAKIGLLGWAAARRATGTRRFALVVGPEGGLTDAEVDGLIARGARACRLSRAVLRIETAAEAALAVLAALDVEG